MTTNPTTYPEAGPELEAFWQNHVLQWRSSGQTQIKYCRSRQLSVHRLRWWKAKFERLAGDTRGPALIPVQVQPSLPESARGSMEGGVRIWLGEGLCVEVAPGFDRATLGAVIQVLGHDPLQGQVFVFINRRRDTIKLLQWDRNGFWLSYKRLERGQFNWPAPGAGQGVLTVEARQLQWLLEGLGLEQPRAFQPLQVLRVA